MFRVYLIGLIFQMKAVIHFLRWGGSTPHTRLAGATPLIPRFCSGIESLTGNKLVYKNKNKSKKHKNSIQLMSGFHLENLAKSSTNIYKSNISEKKTHFYLFSPQGNSLIVVHLSHRNCKNSIWNQSELHLENLAKSHDE